MGNHGKNQTSDDHIKLVVSECYLLGIHFYELNGGVFKLLPGLIEHIFRVVYGGNLHSIQIQQFYISSRSDTDHQNLLLRIDGYSMEHVFPCSQKGTRVEEYIVD